ncbi:hypothetical protein KEM55_008693 [Ascosphaera atra]|nr:hypothetical protein KEM55_008693 [Ascosphaera atra]
MATRMHYTAEPDELEHEHDHDQAVADYADGDDDYDGYFARDHRSQGTSTPTGTALAKLLQDPGSLVVSPPVPSSSASNSPGNDRPPSGTRSRGNSNAVRDTDSRAGTRSRQNSNSHALQHTAPRGHGGYSHSGHQRHKRINTNGSSTSASASGGSRGSNSTSNSPEPTQEIREAANANANGNGKGANGRPLSTGSFSNRLQAQLREGNNSSTSANSTAHGGGAGAGAGAGGTGTTTTRTRKKTRKNSNTPASRARPIKSNHAKKEQEPMGDPPWLASSFRPDPRLPPEQQILPTHAKKMLQEQWEKEGRTGMLYDKNCVPLAVVDDSLMFRPAPPPQKEENEGGDAGGEDGEARDGKDDEDMEPVSPTALAPPPADQLQAPTAIIITTTTYAY